MTPIQILGLLSLLLAVTASVACAARMQNWRHPILLVAMFAFGLMPGSFRPRPQEEPEPQPTTQQQIGALVQTYYERLADEHRSQNAE